MVIAGWALPGGTPLTLNAQVDNIWDYWGYLGVPGNNALRFLTRDSILSGRWRSQCNG